MALIPDRCHDYVHLSCWFIVTLSLSLSLSLLQHPGGEEVLLEQAGTGV